MSFANLGFSTNFIHHIQLFALKRSQVYVCTFVVDFAICGSVQIYQMKVLYGQAKNKYASHLHIPVNRRYDTSYK